LKSRRSIFLKGLKMKNLVSVFAIAGLLFAGQSAEAGVLWAAGTTGGGISNGTWLLQMSFADNNSGNTTVPSGTMTIVNNATSTTYVIALQTTTVGLTTVNPVLTVNEGGVSNDFVSVLSGLGTGALLNSFSATSTENLGVNPNATGANVQALARVGASVTGNIFDTGTFGTAFQNITLSGSVVAPEPGTFALLGGLGLVVGRRIWKRRSAKKQNVATV